MVGKKPSLTLEQTEHVRETLTKRAQLRVQIRVAKAALRALPTRRELAEFYDCAVSTIDNARRTVGKNHEQERRQRAAKN